MNPLILAVDDDDVNLNIIQETLADDPFELRLAQSGSQALEILNDERLEIQVIVLDRMMPGMNGMELLKFIKATPRFAMIPVVMQTAAAAPHEVEQGLRAGAYYYLTKPYSPEALRVILRTALEEGQLRRELALRTREHLQRMRFTTAASFVFRTFDEATEVSTLLAALCPDPAAASVGFTELLLNAVEHGNLGISYAEKSELQRQDRWRAEIERRSALPEYRDRRVYVTFERTTDSLRFVIRDEGDGFQWQRYLEFESARAFDPNGRGIAIAKAMAFGDLNYQGHGNIAVASVALNEPER